MRIATKDELAYLKKHYKKVPASVIAKELGWGRKKVYNEADKLRITRRQTVITQAMVDEIQSDWRGIDMAITGAHFSIGASTVKKILNDEYIVKDSEDD